MTSATQPGLPDRLNYRAFVAPGVLGLADGAFLTAWEMFGPDQEYADFLTMESLAEQLNQDLAKLSSGWMIQAEAIRVPVVLPATENHCPELTSQLIHEERANEYATSGKHYETRLVLTLTWLPPSEVGQQFSHFFFGARRAGKKPSRMVLLSIFQAQAQQLADALGHFLQLRRLDDDELVRFLRYCVTGEDRALGTDEADMHYAVGAVEMKPQRGMIVGKHYRVVGVYGFPRGTHPQMLADLLQLPFSLRLSQRFIFLGTGKAVKELEIKGNKWGTYNWLNPKRIGWQASKNVTGVDGSSEEVVAHNNDAEEQVRSIKREITKLQEGKERGGYFTLVVVVMDHNEDQVEQQAAQILLLLNRKGFTAVVETDNAPDALRGSWPGHGTSNVRKPRLTSRHFTRLMISSSPWRGPETHPSPLYPPNSGPLLICKSTGHTPFFMTPRLHSLIIGPTGNGKTVLLNAMATAHLQYERAQVNFFDLGAGALIPTLACGGSYYDLDAMRYSPLAHIDQEDERAWALDFCERLATLRDFPMNPHARTDLQRAVQDLSKAPIGHRTITGLLGQLQTQEAGLRAALNYYAGSGPGAVLDGTYTPNAGTHWLSFDMQQLQRRSEAVRVPVLMAQIHALEQRMDGRPTFMPFDEGWRAAGDVLLRDFIEESSATARKKAVSLALVLHSPGDLVVFPHSDRLLANVGSYVFLANEMANTEGMRKHYTALGLGSREVKMIAEEMRPRQDYYVVEGNQRRRFQLPWGQWASALFGMDGTTQKARLLALRTQYGAEWLPRWLHERNHTELAMQWEHRTMKKEAA